MGETVNDFLESCCSIDIPAFSEWLGLFIILLAISCLLVWARRWWVAFCELCQWPNNGGVVLYESPVKSTKPENDLSDFRSVGIFQRVTASILAGSGDTPASDTMWPT